MPLTRHKRTSKQHHFKSSNMKCLIFPTASSSHRSAATGAPPSHLGGNMGSGATQQQQHHAMQMAAAPASVDKEGGGGVDEIMWEAPQLARPHPRYAGHGGAVVARGTQAGHHRRNNSLSRIMDNPLDLAAASAAAPGVLPTTNIIMHHQPPLSCSEEYQSDFRDDLHLSSAFEAAAAPRVPLRRPISASPSTRGGKSWGVGVGVGVCGNRAANVYQTSTRQEAQAPVYQANELSDDLAALAMVAANTANQDNLQYQYPVAAKTKHDSSCELEHQMESLSNFGDNLSVKSGSRDKRHRQRRHHSGGGHAKLRRSSKSRHTATTTASTAATAACKGSSSSGTTGGGPHNSHSVAALHRSHRRIGGSMSSVSTRSHRSKRRDRASSRHSHDRRHGRKVPLANFTALGSPPMSPPHEQSEKQPLLSDTMCDCACAEKVAELEHKLESFRIAVLEEMQYSLEYHNSRWSKFDKRYGKELTNLDELFSYRLEAERNDCFQRLESKAAKERTAFALELTNTEKRLISKMSAFRGLTNNGGGQCRPQQQQPRVAGRVTVRRRLSLPEMGVPEMGDTLSAPLGGCVATTPGQHMVCVSTAVAPAQCNPDNDGRDKLSSDRTAAGSSEGGCFARDSGIFDASQSSNASNHNCSSSDVSSPLGSCTAQYFCLASNEKGRRSMHRSNQTIHATTGDSFSVQSAHQFSYHTGAASKSNVSVTDSEVENELNLKSVPVLKCLPSERLRTQEKSNSVAGKSRSFTPRSSTQNDFCNFSLETEALNNNGNSNNNNDDNSGDNVYQNYPEKLERHPVTSPSASAAAAAAAGGEQLKLERKSHKMPVSVGSLVSPVRHPLHTTRHHYRVVQHTPATFTRRESEPSCSVSSSSSVGGNSINSPNTTSHAHMSVSAMNNLPNLNNNHNPPAFQSEQASSPVATLRRPVKETRNVGQQSSK